jgi:hypothetical protein
VLVIVEVRQRVRGDYGGAAASITHAKRRRIVRATRHLLMRRLIWRACRRASTSSRWIFRRAHRVDSRRLRRVLTPGAGAVCPAAFHAHETMNVVGGAARCRRIGALPRRPPSLSEEQRWAARCLCA